MRDVTITAILIFVLALLTLESSSLVAAFFGALLSVQLILALAGKNSLFRSRSNLYRMFINVLLSIFLFVVLSTTPHLLFGFTGAYIMGAALTYAALIEARKT